MNFIFVLNVKIFHIDQYFYFIKTIKLLNKTEKSLNFVFIYIGCDDNRFKIIEHLMFLTIFKETSTFIVKCKTFHFESSIL